MADLNAVRLDEVHAFFARYYHPANASLTLAGDIDPDSALALVRAYFEEIPAGEKVEPVRATASLDRDVRMLLEDRVELPRLYMAWLSPAMFAEGDADLDLAADLLANGKTSRLYRRLVFEERIATDVSASQNSREIGGYLQTRGHGGARPHARGARTGDSGRNRPAGAGGPTDDEIERGRVQAEAQFVFRLQTVGGFGGKSDQLNAYNVFLGDPAYFDRDLQRYYAVTNRSLQQTVRPVFRSCSARDAQHRAARPHRARGARLGSRGRLVKVERLVTVDRSRLPEPGPSGPVRFPAIEKSTLPNGLTVWTVRHAQVPVVAFSLLIRRGASSDPPGKHGLAAMTADMLDEGSGDRSAIEMHEAIARLGTQLETDIGSDGSRRRLHGAVALRRSRSGAARRRRRPAGAQGSATSRACASCVCTG